MDLSRRAIIVGAAVAGAVAATSRGAQAALPPGVSDTPLPPFTNTKRVIVDTDPGNDDAVALLMLMRSPSISIEAITIAPGNVGYDDEVRNALYIVDLAGQSGRIPVHLGAKHALLDRPYPSASFIHGISGLGTFTAPAVRQRPEPEHAADAIRRIVKKYPGEVVIVALGAPTNVALALLREPEIASLIKGIQFTGGPMLGAIPSFNSLADPEATSILLTSGARLSMLGGTTYLVDSLLYKADFEAISKLNTPFSRFFMQSNGLRLKYEVEQRNSPGSVNGDPLSAALIIDPSVGLEHIAVSMKIELEGELTRGTLLYGDNRYNGKATPVPNVNLWTRASNDRFRNLLILSLGQS